MKVSQAIAELSKLPPDLDIRDEYAERIIDAFEVSEYGDEHGDHPFVAYVTTGNE